MSDLTTSITSYGNLLFSGIVAISTVVYAYLTWGLVSETRKMREVQTEPNVYLFIEPRDEHNEITDLFIQNIGMGAAYNIEFNVLSDYMYYESTQRSKKYWASDARILIDGIKYLAPNQKKRIFSTSFNNVKEFNLENRLEIDIRYGNSIGIKKDHVFNINFYEVPENGMSKKDPLVKAVVAIKENICNIGNDISSISSNIDEFSCYFKNNTSIINADYSSLLAAKRNSEQIEIAKALIKKTLLKFYYDWKTCNFDDSRVITDSTLNVQSTNFLEAAVGVTGLLPEKLIEDLLSRITEMKELSSGRMSHNEYVNRFGKIASDIFLMYNDFDGYFDESTI